MENSSILNSEFNEEHRNISEEILFFHKASVGDIKAIRENLSQHRFRDLNGVGNLSIDPILNLKYHLVITAAILARVCIENGLEAEKAFRMSDFYIRKLDYIFNEDEVEKVHDDMVLEFTGCMRETLYYNGLQRPLIQCIDYIYAHLNERITIKELADNVGVSTSFLSREFSKQLGISVSDFIRDKKIEMAQDMLINTDLSILEISCRLAFSSQSHFIQAFKNIVGQTPKQYRSGKVRQKWVLNKKGNERERYPYLFEDEEQD